MISIPHLTLSIISMLSIGVANLLMRFPSRRYGTRRTLVYRGLCMSALLGLGAVLTNAWVFDLKMIIFTLLLSFLGYLPLAAFVKGLSVGKVGVVTPIANSSVIVTVLFSLVFFGEVLTPGQYGGIGLIVLGIVLISINFQDLKQSDLLDPSSGIGYALIALVIWGIFFPLLKIPSSQLGPFMTTFLIEIGILAWAFLHLRLHGTSSI
ncbi:MAG: EamA family transporter, partial [Nanoarchaeota archaeon]